MDTVATAECAACTECGAGNGAAAPTEATTHTEHIPATRDEGSALCRTAICMMDPGFSEAERN
ncbi:hypothetical protein NCCNTM_30660 [Mycolicibacterium sp. NCC-Tsukiji]|nr:hypothetical protein NCCNTM_30660 [Mycolicibacterium sp. NCC-Tsukiji]